MTQNFEPGRTVVIASGSTSTKAGGVLFIKSNAGGPPGYKFYCAVRRPSMHSSSSKFEEQVGGNILKHFQKYLRVGDSVTFIIDKTAFISQEPTSEFPKTAQHIKNTYGIDVRVNIMSKIENLYLQAADFIANDMILDAHACMKSFGADHCP